MFTFEVIILALVAIANMAVVWVVASQGWRVLVNRYFIMAAIFVIFWALGTALFFAADSREMAQIGITTFYVAPMFMIIFLSLFVTVFPAEKGVAFTLPNMLLTIATVLFASIIIYNPSILTESIQLNGTGNNQLFVRPFWYAVYFTYFSSAIMMTFTELYLQIRRYKGYRRKQLIYIFTGTASAAALSIVTNLLLPVLGNGELIWLGPTWTLFYIITVSIAVVKHQLFDIKLAAVRSIAYAGVLITLSAVYYIFAYLMSILVFGGQTSDSLSVSPINILLALILAFLFQPIKRFFDRITDNIFYRDNYKSEEFFAELSNLLTSTTELRGLLERASTEISDTLKAEQVFFYLHYSNGTDHHVTAGTKHHNSLPVYDARILDAYSVEHTETIIVTEMLAEHSQLRRMLVSHKVALVMPLRRAEGTIGYVCLGDHQGRGYTKRDLKVLSTIAGELVIAIQNALSLHEIKEINAGLQQSISNATKELRSSNSQLRHLDEVKDEFMSMASHQLRTPLTSIKGYLSMVIEGDTGEITPQQRRLLEEAFSSSERMVRLIADFLNVSRLQTGKFVIEKLPVDIAKVVKTEVSSLKLIAKTHDIKLAFHTPAALPTVSIDEAKIRQVIMNFVDNAIYYSRSKSTITIKLEEIDGNISFTVTDTGIGVPEDEQASLFNKFFRAKNARKQRPDGTGVGLYLAKKVVMAHGGKMVFSSVENQGSVFGFRIPIDKP
jgi:signal transduction histidine kinase